MLALAAPAYYGFLVAPCGERQDPALAALALESLIVDEAVDRFQDRLVFGPDLCPLLDSPSSMSLQPRIHPPIVLLAADPPYRGKVEALESC